jgi:hypothetical protein
MICDFVTINIRLLVLVRLSVAELRLYTLFVILHPETLRIPTALDHFLYIFCYTNAP